MPDVVERRWVILSSQEPTEVQLSKLKSKLYRKNLKCILVIVLNPKNLCMHFLTAQLNNRNLYPIYDELTCTYFIILHLSNDKENFY